MKELLKINGNSILNFYDLKKAFSPWQIFDQLSEFVKFAEVHCVPLPLQIKNENGETINIRYLNKEFWLNIIKNIYNISNLNYPKSYIEYFTKEKLKDEAGIKDDDSVSIEEKKIRKSIKDEMSELKIFDKLNYIIKSGDLNSKNEDRTAVILLAICIISEVNPFEQNFHKINYDKKDEQLNQIVDFPSTNNLSLSAQSDPYMFWYHDSDYLKKGNKIKTVCIEAKAGTNKYQNVSIELYNARKEKVKYITLDAGDYIYCNISDGKVIKFLPTESCSPSLYIGRKKLSKSEITISPKNSNEWPLDLNGVSSFCADSKNGFVFIQNGRVDTTHYFKFKDNFMIKMRLEMMSAYHVVEANLTEEGYQFLTEDGIIISNYEFDKKSGVVSLNNRE